MSLYGQEAEVALLGACLQILDTKVVVDVGAECGAFIASMLACGAGAVFAFEPEPDNATYLRQRFAANAGVTIHELAVNDTDGELVLRKSVSPDGAPMTFGHTVIDRPNTASIAWGTKIHVPARSLASLMSEGLIPRRVGVLKIDTEGNDLRVLRGMGQVDCDVAMVEHWSDLPDSLGPCPWTGAELVELMRGRNFSHFAYVVHFGEFTIMQWDDPEVPAGYMGNLVFLHDRVCAKLLPTFLARASLLSRHAAAWALSRASAADERLLVIDELVREVDIQSTAAAERLIALEALAQEAAGDRSAAAPGVESTTRLSQEPGASSP